MNSQTITEVIFALSQPEVYSWIISLIGATLTTFIPEKDEDNKKIIVSPFDHMLAIIMGTLVARFGSILLLSLSIVEPAPVLVYLFVGFIGNSFAEMIIKFFRKLKSDKVVDVLYDILKSYLTRKFKQKD